MLTIQNNWETGNKGSLETFCSPPRVNGTFSYFSYQVIAVQCQWFAHKQTVKYHCCGDILQDSVWFIFWVGVAQGRGFPAFSPGSKMVQVILSEQHLYFCMSTCISIRCAVTFFFFFSFLWWWFTYKDTMFSECNSRTTRPRFSKTCEQWEGQS